MKTKILLIAILLFTYRYAISQDTNEKNTRFIEVTGSAEMEVEPDEIIFEIKYGEYWKEEFEKGKEYKDYVNKIPFEEVEKSLMIELNSIGITQDKITTSDATSSNYWVSEAKGFRKCKTILISLTDFKKVNEIINNVKTKGVNYMDIAELKNKKITEYRKEVKIEAIKAAKEKATYLLQSVGENIGKVISVVESDNNYNSGYYWNPQAICSNSMMSQSSGSGDSNNSSMRKIKLKYEIKVRFEIQ